MEDGDKEYDPNLVTAEMIKQVRKETRAGTLDCRVAIIDSKGDISKAIELLKQKKSGAPKKVWT